MSAVDRLNAGSEPIGDAALVALARAGDRDAVRLLVTRHNRQLFRVARSVLHDDGEAEDVVQEAYVRAFTALDGFRGESSFSTWLVRIALNEALGRARRNGRTVSRTVEQIEAAGGEVLMFPGSMRTPDPEEEAGRDHVRRLLERALDGIPEPFRLVFVLREVEGLSADETADRLGIRPETVRTRLHRARRLLRAVLERDLAPRFADVFPFDGARCTGMADRVADRLASAPGAAPPRARAAPSSAAARSRGSP